MADVFKSAVVAAQYWTDKIQDTANLANFNIGETGVANDIISLFGALNATSYTPTPEAATVFFVTLQKIIMRELEHNPEKPVSLDCDYGPNYLLQEAAGVAGIDFSVFPLKRTMRVNAKNVTISFCESGKQQTRQLM